MQLGGIMHRRWVGGSVHWGSGAKVAETMLFELEDEGSAYNVSVCNDYSRL